MQGSVRADQFVYSRLAGDADLVSRVDGRIYSDVATLEAAYPMVVYSLYSAQDQLGVGMNRVLTRLTYIVKAVGVGGSWAPLALIADRIDAVLHGAENVTLPDGTVVHACVREREIKYPEVVDGVVYRHLGGIYAITLQTPA